MFIEQTKIECCYIIIWQTVENVSGDEFVFLVASGFTRPNMSELLRIKKYMVEKRVSMFRAVSFFVFFFFRFRHTHTASISLRFLGCFVIFRCLT